jgi:hypothetical protein
VLAGGPFPVNGMPFAFCDAGVLSELPWAKATFGAAMCDRRRDIGVAKISTDGLASA